MQYDLTSPRPHPPCRADYFAQRAEDDIDRLWDEGILSEEVMEEWKTEHMRTPYAH